MLQPMRRLARPPLRPPAAISLPPFPYRRLQEHAAFRYRKRSRTVVDTAEEAYLRVDIPCGAGAVCAACPPTAPALALLDGPLALGAFAAADGAAQAPPPHLLLPDAGTLLECLEVFELPQMSNVVLLASELHQARAGPSAACCPCWSAGGWLE